MKYTVKKNEVINGRIDHLNLDSYSEIDCSWLCDLAELPLWPSLC